MIKTTLAVFLFGLNAAGYASTKDDHIATAYGNNDYKLDIMDDEIYDDELNMYNQHNYLYGSNKNRLLDMYGGRGRIHGKQDKEYPNPHFQYPTFHISGTILFIYIYVRIIIQFILNIHHAYIIIIQDIQDIKTIEKKEGNIMNLTTIMMSMLQNFQITRNQMMYMVVLVVYIPV